MFWFYLYLFIVSCCFFFFSSRRRHTRFKCDWSSDVCSSDLLIPAGGRPIVGSRSDPTELMRRSLPAAVVRRMLDQEGTTREYRGLEGEEVVGTMKAVPRLDWAVLAEVPASEAFRQVTRLRNVTVLIVAAR